MCQKYGQFINFSTGNKIEYVCICNLVQLFRDLALMWPSVGFLVFFLKKMMEEMGQKLVTAADSSVFYCCSNSSAPSSPPGSGIRKNSG